MKRKFKELTLELWEDDLGYSRVRFDNVNKQYIEVLATRDKYNLNIYITTNVVSHITICKHSLQC